MFGFYAGGANYLGNTQDCDFIGCLSVNPGYNDIQNDLDGPPMIPFAHAGFVVYSPDNGPYPDRIRFLACKALDKQGFYLTDAVGGYPTTRADDQPVLAAGTTEATMTEAWTGYTRTSQATFSNGDVRRIKLTNGSANIRWSTGLSTDLNGINSNFVSLPAQMRYGFLKENPAADVSNSNTVDASCVSVGAIIGDFSGF